VSTPIRRIRYAIHTHRHCWRLHSSARATGRSPFRTHRRLQRFPLTPDMAPKAAAAGTPLGFWVSVYADASFIPKAKAVVPAGLAVESSVPQRRDRLNGLLLVDGQITAHLPQRDEAEVLGHRSQRSRGDLGIQFLGPRCCARRMVSLARKKRTVIDKQPAPPTAKGRREVAALAPLPAADRRPDNISESVHLGRPCGDRSNGPRRRRPTGFSRATST
jgi:hypothetical protein